MRECLREHHAKRPQEANLEQFATKNADLMHMRLPRLFFGHKRFISSPTDRRNGKADTEIHKRARLHAQFRARSLTY